MLIDGVPLVIDSAMASGTVVREAERVRAHCMICAMPMIRDFPKRFALVETVPPCLFDKGTGELVDL